MIRKQRNTSWVFILIAGLNGCACWGHDKNSEVCIFEAGIAAAPIAIPVGIALTPVIAAKAGADAVLQPKPDLPANDPTGTSVSSIEATPLAPLKQESDPLVGNPAGNSASSIDAKPLAPGAVSAE